MVLPTLMPRKAMPMGSPPAILPWRGPPGTGPIMGRHMRSQVRLSQARHRTHITALPHEGFQCGISKHGCSQAEICLICLTY